MSSKEARQAKESELLRDMSQSTPSGVDELRATLSAKGVASAGQWSTHDLNKFLAARKGDVTRAADLVEA